jgi:glycosyltransferase involved in cell wall biosynthesis
MRYPKITIVTPCYNKAEYLEQTILSVVGQNYPNLEYLIYDAKSTDKSLKIIKKYTKLYPNIVGYVSKKDRGQWDAVNNGFTKAKGDILGFLNADDLLQEGALLKLAETVKSNPNSYWFAGKSVVINSKSEQILNLIMVYKNMLLTFNIKMLLIVVNYLMQPSVFITKKAFTKFGLFTGEGKYIMEYDYWLRLAQLAMPVVIPAVLSKFRMATGMASMSYADTLLASDEKIVKKYTSNRLLLSMHRFHNYLRKIFANNI